MNPMAKLVMLYESEINWELSCYYDGGYIVRLGDVANGFTAMDESFHESIEKAVDYLWDRAKETYPTAACFDKNALV